MTQGRSSSWAAQPLLVSETMGKALAAEVTPCAAGCGAVSGHPISAGYKTGRFRRQGAGAAPISAGARVGFVGMLRVVCLYLTQLPSWRAEKQIGCRRPAPLAAAQETLGFAAYTQGFCIGLRRCTGQAHRGVRPSCIRIAAAAVRGRYEVIFAS